MYVWVLGSQTGFSMQFDVTFPLIQREQWVDGPVLSCSDRELLPTGATRLEMHEFMAL